MSFIENENAFGTPVDDEKLLEQQVEEADNRQQEDLALEKNREDAEEWAKQMEEDARLREEQEKVEQEQHEKDMQEKALLYEEQQVQQAEEQEQLRLEEEETQRQ
jgi:hypothetical protein